MKTKAEITKELNDQFNSIDENSTYVEFREDGTWKCGQGGMVGILEEINIEGYDIHITGDEVKYNGRERIVHDTENIFRLDCFGNSGNAYVEGEWIATPKN